jgi:hypothetical protein
MRTLFASGHIIDLILLAVAAEAVGLAIWHRRTGRGPTPAALFGLLLPGVCLLAALREALAGAWWVWIAAWLLAALVAHLRDLAHRWRG